MNQVHIHYSLKTGIKVLYVSDIIDRSNARISHAVIKLVNGLLDHISTWSSRSAKFEEDYILSRPRITFQHFTILCLDLVYLQNGDVAAKLWLGLLALERRWKTIKIYLSFIICQLFRASFVLHIACLKLHLAHSSVTWASPGKLWKVLNS